MVTAPPQIPSFTKLIQIQSFWSSFPLAPLQHHVLFLLPWKNASYLTSVVILNGSYLFKTLKASIHTKEKHEVYVFLCLVTSLRVSVSDSIHLPEYFIIFLNSWIYFHYPLINWFAFSSDVLWQNACISTCDFKWH